MTLFKSLRLTRIGVEPLSAALVSVCTLVMPANAGPADAVVREAARIGKANLLVTMILIACLFSSRLIESRARKIVLGLALLTFFVAQGRNVLVYSNASLYQHRKLMTISDLQIIDDVYTSRWFSGKNVLPLVVADYMPRAKIFIYDDTVYTRELLSWSGRNPDSTFIVGAYDPTMDDSFKAACLSRPHVLYKGRASVPFYVATPLSIYEKEAQVFLMKDAVMNYLIPGSWLESKHE